MGVTLPLDKLAHALGGYALALTAIVLGASPGAALLLAGVVGAAKEGYDLATGRGTPEWADLLATVAGAMLACGVGAL